LYGKALLDSVKNTSRLFLQISNKAMIEPLLTGIVLGLVPVTLIGLFVAAYLQYTRGNELSRMIKEEEEKRAQIKTSKQVARR